MKFARNRSQWTLGALMALIAVVSLPMAWYSYRASEVARQQAVADALRGKIEARIYQLLESMVAQNKLDQTLISGEIARAKSPTEPSGGSIPERATVPRAETVEQPR